jgi:uracil DNA glycosylase
VLTDTLIRQVADGDHPVVFMLWGAHAQSKRALDRCQAPQGAGGQPSLAAVGLAAAAAFYRLRPFLEGAGMARRAARKPDLLLF